MAECKACKTAQGEELRFQEVLTQHIRGFRESRVQALGDVVTLRLCEECVQGYLQSRAEPSLQRINRRSLLLALGGVAVWQLLPRLGIPNMQLFGIGLLLFAVLGYFQSRNRVQTHAVQAQQALQGQGRDLFVEEYAAALLPRKSGENDLSYILLRPELGDMKAGDLAVRYQLVPQIALQLHERLASFNTEGGEDVQV